MRGAGRDEIRVWFEEAQAAGATHMLVVCDTFDHEDYPAPVPDDEYATVEAAIKYYKAASMQRVMEVYRIDLGWEKQSVGRAWNL